TPVIEGKLGKHAERRGIGEDAVAHGLDVARRRVEEVRPGELVSVAREERVEATVEEDVNEVRWLGRSKRFAHERAGNSRTRCGATQCERSLQQATTGKESVSHGLLSRSGTGWRRGWRRKRVPNVFVRRVHP